MIQIKHTNIMLAERKVAFRRNSLYVFIRTKGILIRTSKRFFFDVIQNLSLKLHVKHCSKAHQSEELREEPPEMRKNERKINDF